MRNPFPPLNMEMFLQQVVESQLGPLLDSLSSYKRIKVKGENVHKTTFITNCDTMPYKCCLLAYLMQVPPLKGLYTQLSMNWSVSMLILMI
jgi:hypothetical protein